MRMPAEQLPIYTVYTKIHHVVKTTWWILFKITFLLSFEQVKNNQIHPLISNIADIDDRPQSPDKHPSYN